MEASEHHPDKHVAVEQDETTAEPREEPFRLGRRGQMVFFSLAVLALMVALDGTSLSVALPIISRRLGGTAIEAFWAGTAYLLCAAVFQPCFASFSNIFGRRSVVMTALLFFLVGAVVAGVAQNFTHMLVGRSIQGIGGAGIMTLSSVLVTDIVPLRKRGAYLGILSSMWSVGSVVGPILGGGFAGSVSWRWIFYINFPFIGIAAVVTLIFLKLNRPPTSFVHKLRQVDYAGMVLLVASLCSFLIAITWGGVSYAWSSWHTLVPLVVGALGLCLFVVYELLVPAEPMIPLTIFMTPTTAVSYLGNFAQGIILWCILYYLPLYYEAVRGYRPVIAGVALFPETFTVAPCSVATGIAISITGRFRWAIWSAWVFVTLGCGLLCIITPTTSIPGWIFLNIVPGIGLGILYPSLAYAVHASVSDRHLSMAASLTSFFRSLGQCVGVAIGGVIFQNQMQSELRKYPELAARATEYSQEATELVLILNGMQDGLEKTHIKQAYTDSLRIIWAVCCAISGVALASSLLTRRYNLDRSLNTKQGLKREG
ncbi:major facilitator superfamily domain-containing protein [Aspergillus granulosus]|uniref:Major facilitator superfamily domain-containing protein n=1 Tax=Aspergillus granulosus TaxID=176169 RepID=A0ABR4HES3_9EURO